MKTDDLPSPWEITDRLADVFPKAQTPEQQEEFRKIFLSVEQLVKENEKLKKKNNRNAGRKGPTPERLEVLRKIAEKHKDEKNRYLRKSHIHSAYNEYLNHS